MSVSERDLQKAARKVGSRIKALRQAGSFTQVELERRAGVYDVGAIERGEKNPTLLTLLRLASALEVSVEDLLSESGRSTPSAEEQLRMEILGLLQGLSRTAQRRALKVLRALVE